LIIMLLSRNLKCIDRKLEKASLYILILVDILGSIH
jgi:hypothetical protein